MEDGEIMPKKERPSGKEGSGSSVVYEVVPVGHNDRALLVTYLSSIDLRAIRGGSDDIREKVRKQGLQDNIKLDNLIFFTLANPNVKMTGPASTSREAVPLLRPGELVADGYFFIVDPSMVIGMITRVVSSLVDVLSSDRTSKLIIISTMDKTLEKGAPESKKVDNAQVIEVFKKLLSLDNYASVLQEIARKADLSRGEIQLSEVQKLLT
jgi:hypothetical protein